MFPIQIRRHHSIPQAREPWCQEGSHQRNFSTTSYPGKKRMGETQQASSPWRCAAFVSEDSHGLHQWGSQMMEQPRVLAAASSSQDELSTVMTPVIRGPKHCCAPILLDQDASAPCYIQSRTAEAPPTGYQVMVPLPLLRVSHCCPDSTLGLQFSALNSHCQGQAVTSLQPVPWVLTCP